MTHPNKEIFLTDYKRPSFWFRDVYLDFDIQKDHTIVTSKFNIERNMELSDVQDIELIGVDLELLSLKINGNDCEYEISGDRLFIKTGANNLTLESVVKINPYTNLSCEGLYKSGDILCTQNEAEGFRKITYYPDRPDVMAKFMTKISADKKTYPVLLANGNKIESGDLAGDRHFAVWSDPHLKPCYLYALVAGDLAMVADSFTTMSGQKVALEIFVDKGNEHKCSHAMESLKNSMKWDEEKFGLEYDLDIYMVVAVDSFNMGAMENKGLNIFNSAYVLASTETATDTDFQGIEAVIGHEYFHNWTGNRVTCRDWFQLTLKEGLTVFRDQEFSADMQTRAVTRINDVAGLRSRQFSEDAGPNSHPIKPKSFVEINNFYTATIYDKGAEIIRMYQTLLGKEKFREGMDLYFERHDGQAVTTEDFTNAMSTASGANLDQFSVWYDQNGTPVLDISTSYDETTKDYTISVTQTCKLNSTKFNALHIPFHFVLYTIDGELITLPKNGKFELKEKNTKITLKDIPADVTPSWNTNFAAPVIINYNYSNQDLAFLMASDKDEFNRYDACQKIYKKTIEYLINKIEKSQELELPQQLTKGFENILLDKKLDPAFVSLALTLPTEEIYHGASTVMKIDETKSAITFMNAELGAMFKDHFYTIVELAKDNKSNDISAHSMGIRSLKNVALQFIASADDNASEYLMEIFSNEKGMTGEAGCLNAILKLNSNSKDEAISKFYEKWKHETLVMQKWIKAIATSADSLDTLKKIEGLEIYDPKIPNLVRSLLGGFGALNPSLLNAADGSGYKYLVDQIILLDAYNPQIASRTCTYLNHLKKLKKPRQGLLRIELSRLAKVKNLSSDSREIIEKILI